jgi:hypothetical protein
VDYKIGKMRILQLAADTTIEAKFPGLRKTIIVLGASLSPAPVLT